MASTSNEVDWRITEYDKQCHPHFTISALNKARRLGRFADVQFVLGKGKSKKVFHAHKVVLACGSAVFEKMFYGTMAEKRSVIKTDDDPEAFDILMNYFYGQCKQIASLIYIWKLYIIGDKYLVPKILDIAKGHVANIKITQDDFWDVIESDVFSHPLFFDKVYSFLKENTETIIKSEKFLYVQENFLDQLLRMEDLKVHEYDLLLAVTEWGYKNLKPANSENLLPFYKQIQFTNLSCDEYFRFIDSYPEAIEAKSSLEILQYLYTPYGRCLPFWCLSSQTCRKNDLDRENVLTVMLPQDMNIDANLFI